MGKVIRKVTTLSVLIFGAALFSVASAEDARARLGMEGQPITADSQQEIRQKLAEIVTSATDNDFEDLLDNLTEADRNRLGNISLQDVDKATFSQVRDAIKNRYGSMFDWDSMDVKQSVFNYEMTKGTTDKVANVKIPTSHGLPSLTLKFVDEGVVKTTWRLDLPDAITGDQLKTSLTQHMMQINQEPMKFPTDKHQGAGYIAHHIFTALGGLEMQRGQLGSAPTNDLMDRASASPGSSY